MTVPVTVPKLSPVPITRAGLAQWVIDLCHFYGADLATSLKVAGLFITDFEDTPDGVRLKGLR